LTLIYHIMKSHAARGLLLLAALSVAACVSLEEMAPPVSALRSTSSSSSAQLAHGRDIYITKCAKCHSVEPVLKYPLSQWEHEILPEMSEETNLSPQEVAAVSAYVRAVFEK
jgi:mono/diheme cytochrome c family protein